MRSLARPGRLLIGETADELEALLAGACRCAAPLDGGGGRHRRRVDAARRRRAASPAAASFDMFVDYAARGDAFRAAVERLERPMTAATLAVGRGAPRSDAASAASATSRPMRCCWRSWR